MILKIKTLNQNCVSVTVELMHVTIFWPAIAQRIEVCMCATIPRFWVRIPGGCLLFCSCNWHCNCYLVAKRTQINNKMLVQVSDDAILSAFA